MGVYNTLESKRKAQFESYKLNRFHNFFFNNIPGNGGDNVKLVDLKGNDDENGLVLPNNSTAYVQLNALLFPSTRYLSQINQIDVDGSGVLTLNNSASFPVNIVDDNGSTAFVLKEEDGALKLEATNPDSIVVNLHATLELLAYSSNKGFTNAI